MKKMLLLLLLCSSRVFAADVVDVIDCSIINDDAVADVGGMSRVLFSLSNTLTPGCIITPEASQDGTTWFAQAVKRENVTDVAFAPALNSTNTALNKVWIYTNPGYGLFRLRISTLGTPGFVGISMTTGVEDSRSVVPVLARHPEAFRCTMTSTATTLTEITGCRNSVGSTVNFSALCSGKTCYVTAIQWFSSIISTTANNMLLRTGSGTNCATGTTDVYRGYSAPAFTGNIVDFPDATPLQLPFGNYLCFIHPGAGTRFVNLQGYVAP